jgi:hypothetical protein
MQWRGHPQNEAPRECRGDVAEIVRLAGNASTDPLGSKPSGPQTLQIALN